MAAAVNASPSLSRMLAADTSIPSRLASAYADSKQAQAAANSPAELASLPLLMSCTANLSRASAGPVNAAVGTCEMILGVGTFAIPSGNGLMSSLMSPIATVFLSVRFS